MPPSAKRQSIDSKAEDYPYKETHVLLTNSEKGETVIKKDSEILGLCLLRYYGASTLTYVFIPSVDPRLYAGLFLRYGHGGLDGERNLIWSARADSATSLKWRSLQVYLEEARSDAPLLISSCYSAAAIGRMNLDTQSNGGTTELLAACGFETITPLQGSISFTNPFIEDPSFNMRRGNGPSFPIAPLQLRLRTDLLQQGPCAQGQWPSTPIHLRLAEGPSRPVIIISQPVDDIGLTGASEYCCWSMNPYSTIDMKHT
ncbi:hypothetical protein BDZ45DRAFT_807973 [Acephala macrosclerotiorum]|nr:hypothetical protein BDZ45DRAFT_807973 [Acephala macrosclerotiorum]